jgi:DNA-directed RNA polymerase specialized sigma24 family protein
MPPEKKKAWTLDQDAFDRMLAWLDSDRNQAGRRYESIRLRLIKIFACRGCKEPEDLADETINRVARKIHEISEDYAGDPAHYFYGVAIKVHLEYVRVKPAATPPPQVEIDTDLERQHECLDRCLRTLPPQSRDLVLGYYREERQAKIDHRKELAAQFGIAVNALRIRAHRIRTSLQDCVTKCLDEVAQ